MRYLRFVFVALAIGAWAAGPLPSALAQAAPSYQSSDPGKGEMMDHPPAEVTVTFDQPLDESSWMNVLDECGNEIDAGPASVDLNELTVQIGDRTPSGMYEVVYKAVGLAGATGSSGSSFEFMVHHGAPCGGGGGGHDHDKKKKHGDHDKRPGGGHDDHDDDSTDHTDHSGMTGMTGAGHTGHTTGPTGHEGSGHGNGHGKDHGNHHRGGSKPPPGEAEPPPLATGDSVPVGADGQAVLIGLGLALAVGVLGGWLLRMSSTPSGA